jgi:hypothetical protein
MLKLRENKSMNDNEYDMLLLLEAAGMESETRTRTARTVTPRTLQQGSAQKATSVQTSTMQATSEKRPAYSAAAAPKVRTATQSASMNTTKAGVVELLDGDDHITCAVKNECEPSTADRKCDYVLIGEYHKFLANVTSPELKTKAEKDILDLLTLEKNRRLAGK